MMWLSLTFAFAADGDLELERARRLLAEGRPLGATEILREVTSAQPDRVDAWITWLDTCELLGVSVGCRAELALIDQDAATAALLWHDRVMERTKYGPEDQVPALLVDLDNGQFGGAGNAYVQMLQIRDLARKDPDGAASLAVDYLSSDPTHPEVVAPLFDPKLPPQKSVAKAKKKVSKLGRGALGRSSPEELYRWHMVYLASPDLDATLTRDALAEAGEAPPLDRYPFTRAEQVQEARRLLDVGAQELPTHSPGEREGVMLKLAELLESTGRTKELDKAYSTARSQHDSVSMALSHGSVLLAAGKLERAMEVSEQALALAAVPWPTDAATTVRIARRDGVAQALVLRGRVRLAQGDPKLAVIDLMVANQLSFRPMGTDALEKAMETGRYELERVKAGLETRAKAAHEVALDKARKALEEEDYAEVDSSASAAVASLCVPSHSKARLTARLAGLPELSSAYALRALAASRSGNKEQALEHISIATLLLPRNSPADWWQLKGELHEAAGHGHAAFFARAMAASLDDELPAIESDWLWPLGTGQGAGPALVAEWMRGNEVEPAGDVLKVQRGRVVAFRAPSSGKGGSGSGGRRPVLNTPFPKWSVTTEHGVAAAAPGRMYFVTFFRADSPSSVRSLDELTALARRLRGAGVDIKLVGISMDPEKEALDALGGKMEQWGTTGWDPGMAQRFGVNAVPTTWVVDSEGIARFHHVGYLGTSEYEAEVRFITGL